MPNHISNRVFFQSPNRDDDAETSALKQLETMMKTEESSFDFNVLIPYPQQYAEADKARLEAEKRGVKWGDLPKDGYNQGGYEWCHSNWGTKWNAYDITWDYDSVYFCTAWSSPEPIWEELSKRFPDLILMVEYADEDTGHNCGILAYRNGTQTHAETDDDGLPNPVLFARAIMAEQQCRYYAGRWQDANTQIAELEKQISELTAKLYPKASEVDSRSDLADDH